MKSKRILSIILVFVMVFAMAVTAWGKKEEAAEKEEPKQEETSDIDEAEVDDVGDDAAVDAEEPPADKGKKTGDDMLTDEDVQSLKDSIRDTVISEYLEPNSISVEDFAWPDKDSGELGYMSRISQEYTLRFSVGETLDVSKIDSSSYSNPEIMEAAFNGIINWLDKQGKYDYGYLENVLDSLVPYKEVIPTIDLAAK